MPESAQEREFKTWGIDKSLRRGILVGIISLQFIAIYYLFYRNEQNRDNNEEFLKRLVEDKLREPVKDVQRAVEHVESSTSRIDSLVDADSLNINK